RPEVWSICVVDRGRDRHDEEVSCRELRLIALKHEIRPGQLRRINLARTVATRAQLADPPTINIEANDRRPGSGEGDRDRQPDVTEADDCDPTAVVSHVTPSPGTGVPQMKAST